MRVLNFIKAKKKEFHDNKRAKTQQRLTQIKDELKVVKAEGEVHSLNAKLTKDLRKSKKDLFEAKHPYISAGLKGAGKKIKQNQARHKAGNNPFMSTGTSPFSYQPENPFQPKKKKASKKKGKTITIRL